MSSDERRPAGPASDTSPAPTGAGPASSPPAGEAPGSSPADEVQPPAGDSDDDQGAGRVEEDFEKLLRDAHQERDEYLELARRTQADFENYRKRMAAEVQAAQARGKVSVAQEVIDAVDNLERALEAGDGDGEGLRAGVEMVLGGLRETLSRNGIEAVDPKGEKFDPNRHEALSTQPAEGIDSGVVIEVLQKGYALGDQLVRPARVVVSS